MTRLDKIEHFMVIFLKGSIGIIAAVSVVRGDYFLAFSGLFYLAITAIPSLVGRRLKVQLPVALDLIFALIVYAHFFLGYYQGFYHRIAWWDLFLHTADSALLGLIGFAFIYTLTLANQIKAKPFFVALYSVCLAVTLGVVWEIFEFWADVTFGTSMQAGGLGDTMSDLIADLLGSLAVGTVGFLYMKDGKPEIFQRILQKITDFKKIRKL